MKDGAGLRTYYEDLGIADTATQRQIKQAYRRRILQLHPDQARRGNTAVQFQRVREAYDVLSDPARRRRYDVALGMGSHAHRPGTGGSSLDRLFDGLFDGLQAGLRRVQTLCDRTDLDERRAG
jgi:molecular chaperone DnaJ